MIGCNAAKQSNAAHTITFVAQSRAARAEAKRRLVARIVAAAQKDWKAAAWVLEKLFPAEYGANAEVEPKSNNVGVTICYDTGGKSIRELLTFPILGKDAHEEAELEATQEENIAFWESQVQSSPPIT